MIQRGCLLLILCLGYIGVYGQCTKNDTLAIPDLDTIYYEIEISSIANDDLSNGQQGVALVHLDFKHQKISDLKINLISPAGEKVLLVGPSSNVPKWTQGTNWSVNFVPGGSTLVAPDNPFGDKWSNKNDWLNIENYSGTYFPFQGDLKDFNVGSVSGAWRLEIIDAQENGNEPNPITSKPFSFIYGFSISFVDNTGLTCFSCAPSTSSITSAPIEGCMGSIGLDYEVAHTIDQNNPNYNYRFLLFDAAGKLKQVFDDSSIKLSTIEEGVYTLCGLSIYKEDLVQLSQLSNRTEIEHSISSGSICATLSASCQNVQISPQNIVKTITGELCGDMPYVYNGVSYGTEGTYLVKEGGTSLCENYVEIKVSEKDLEVLITPSNPSFSCDLEQITLTPEKKSGLTYTWETTVPNGISMVNEDDVATIIAPGKYVLRIKSENCETSKEVVIPKELDYIKIELVAENIECKKLGRVVANIIDGGIKTGSQKWYKDGIHLPSFDGSFEIKDISEPGVYKIEVDGVGTCKTSQEIDIKDESPMISINASSSEMLTCSNMTFETKISGVTTDDYRIEWYRDNNPVASMVQDYTVNTSGKYRVEVTGKNNTCEEKFEFDVSSNIDYYSTIVVNPSEITCARPESKVEFLTFPPAPYTSIKWKSGNDVLSTKDTLYVDTPGQYTIELVTQNGCVQTQDFDVQANVATPNLTIPDTVRIRCEDNAMPILGGTYPDLTWQWKAPSGATSSTIPVSKELGSYVYTATSTINGCKKDGVVVLAVDETSLPAITFEVDTLTCNTTSVTIVPSNKNNYLFTWTRPDMSTFSGTEHSGITSGGRYKVRVSKFTDPTCFVDYFVPVIMDTVSVLQDIVSDNITCKYPSVQLVIQSPYSFESIAWAPNPGLSSTVDISPYVDRPGTYRVAYTFLENGCSGIDSITVSKDAAIPNPTFAFPNRDTIKCKDTIHVRINPGINLDSLSNILWYKEDKIIGDTVSSITLKEPGKYKVLVEGRGNCIDSLEFEIFADTLPPTFQVTPSNDIYCNKETSILQISNQNRVDSLAWYDARDTLLSEKMSVSVTEPGIYKVHAIDQQNNCVGEEVFEIMDKRVYPDIAVSNDTILSCLKREVSPTISSESGTSFVWLDDNGSVLFDMATIKIDSTQMLIARVLNDQECATEATVNIKIDTIAPQIAFAEAETLTCTTTEVELKLESILEEWSYLWLLDGSNKPTLKVDRQDTYTLEVKGANGCTTRDSIRVSMDTTSIRIDTIFNTPLVCNGPQAHINVVSLDSVVSYRWDGVLESQQFEKSPIIVRGGMYRGFLTGVNGCVKEVNLEVDDGRRFPYIDASDVYTRCDGKPTLFVIDSINGVDDIRWIGIDNDYFFKGEKGENKESGRYQVLGVNAEGCQVRDTFRLIDQVVLPDFNLRADEFTCTGGAVYALNVEDDEAFEWQGPDGFTSDAAIVTIDSLAEYKLIVTSIYGCKDTMTVTPIDIRVKPTPMVQQSAPFQCNTESVGLVANTMAISIDRAVFQWFTTEGKIESNPNKDSIHVSKTGEYTIRIYDTKSRCSDSTTYRLVQEEQSFKSFDVEPINPSCESLGNGRIILSNIVGDYPPYEVFINGASRGVTSEVNYLRSGEYIVSLVDSIECTVVDTITIEEPTNPILDLPKDTLVAFGTLLEINPLPGVESGEIDSIVWSSNVECMDCPTLMMKAVSEEYITVYVKSKDGCEDSAEMKLRVIKPDRKLFPNAFSPNGDDVNDRFYIEKNVAFTSLDRVSIYSHWGDLLYDSDKMVLGDPETGWDGRFRGKYVNPGVYVVHIYATLSTGEKRRFVNTLTVRR